MKSLRFCAYALIVLIATACSRESDAGKAAQSQPVPSAGSQAAPADPGKPDKPVALGKSFGTDAGNPQAGFDQVFNTPVEPVLDVSKSKADFAKIVADALK